MEHACERLAIITPVITERASTVIPAAYFDQLVTSLDEPDDAPRLTQAALEAKRRRLIKTATSGRRSANESLSCSERCGSQTLP